MNAKEEIISTISQSMSVELPSNQIDSLIYCISEVLKSYSIEPADTLPSINQQDTNILISRFLASKKIEGCQQKTLISYKYSICRFSDVVNTDLKTVDSNTIRCYLGYLSKGNQNSYVDSQRRNINSFYQWLESEDYIQKNPCKKIKKIKIEKKMEIPFSDIELARIQDSCKTGKEIALVDILISTGIRREEITKIKISDIYWDNRAIKINGKGAKERIVYISARCQLHLQNYINNRGFISEWLFAQDRVPHGQLSVESMHKYIKDLGKRAHVDNVHLHRFRKYFGTSMANKGVDIRDLKEMMGHEKIDTTNEYYIYANMQRIKSEHQRFAL